MFNNKNKNTHTDCLGLEERLRAQTKSTTVRVTGKSSRYVLKDDKIQSYIDKHGNSYKIGGKPIGTANKMNYSFLSDHVYLEMNKSNEPYSIACILDFRLVNVLFFRSICFIFHVSFVYKDKKRSCSA